jgi:DMSO/TMAO reductase YedYZ molybdopterin-dependent catalytic subunit
VSERFSKRPVSRRVLLTAIASAGLAACDGKHPRSGALGLFDSFNKGAQSLFYRSGSRGRPGAITPEGGFPAYYISPSIPMPPAGWVLKVGGLVERPMEFSLEDLTKLTRTDVRVEHHCVEGWSAIADWHGVRLSELAEVVGAKKVDFVEFRSFDSDYWSSWDRESAMHAETLIAYGMNGAPLGPAHGAPARVYGSVKLGYKSVKYLSEVNFLDHETGGYWENLGYEWFAGT